MILLHLLAFAGYLGAAWLQWRSPGSTDRSGPEPIAGDRVFKAQLWLLALAMLLHTALVLRGVFTPEGLNLSFANALSVVSGLAVAVAWIGGLLRSLPTVTLIVLPVAAIGSLLPALLPSSHRFPYFGEAWATAHIAVALVAYALFIVAALQAMLLISLERRLHKGLADRTLPPLLTLERFLFQLVLAGYILLTLTLISGIFFSEQLFGRPLQFNHKTVFSVLSWLVFGTVLFGRFQYGWRGKTALRWILGGTVLLLLAYAGSKFVLEVLLHR